MQPHRHAVEEQIARLASLCEVTDEWSPKRPSERALESARSLAEAAWHDELPIPSLVATSDGGVHVKWQRGSRHLSAFVFPDGSIEYLTVEKGHPVVNHITENGRFSDLLSWLMR